MRTGPGVSTSFGRDIRCGFMPHGRGGQATSSASWRGRSELGRARDREQRRRERPSRSPGYPAFSDVARRHIRLQLSDRVATPQRRHAVRTSDQRQVPGVVGSLASSFGRSDGHALKDGVAYMLHGWWMRPYWSRRHGSERRCLLATLLQCRVSRRRRSRASSEAR